MTGLTGRRAEFRRHAPSDSGACVSRPGALDHPSVERGVVSLLPLQAASCPV